MFGLEPWFVYSIISAISGGAYIFATKVAVERGYDGTIFNTLGSLISAIFLIILTGFIAGYSVLAWAAVAFVGANAFFYMIGNIVRYDALGCIDTAIFYPLYKTLSPILVILAGIMLFGERFTLYEVVGLILSVTVPLLLVSSKENGRQRNLKRGLRLLVAAAFLAAVAAIMLKFAVSYADNIWQLSAVAHGLLVVVGIGILLRKKKPSELFNQSKMSPDKQYIFLIGLMGICHAFSFAFFMLAFASGPISLVYTIQSLYILIPIILSIIFYNEHWNFRKIIAIILSIAALGLLK
jgi:drug/metabolite transporter (DMT)-like permease